MKVAVPDSLLEEIQQLQDTFGAAMNQAIVLTDQEGSMITRPTITGRFYKGMLDSLQGISRPFQQPLRRLGTLSHPAVIEEWIPGLKAMVSPLAPGCSQVHYLWSGLYMEHGSKEQVLRIFAAQMKHLPDYEQLLGELSAMPEFSRERIAEVREKLAVLGSIICKLLAGWVLKPQAERSGMIIARLLEQLEADFLHIETVLQLLAETAAGDLYAFAQETEEGQFKVKHAAGKDAHLLLNAVFRPEPCHLRAGSQDSGSLYFTQLGHGIPDYLSCYPVLINNDLRGLMLAAGSGSKGEEQGNGQQESMMASLLGISYRGERLLHQVQLDKAGALRLKEAAGLLPQAGSLRELGGQLLDIVMGLPLSPSSVLVYFQDKEQPDHKYLARGWTSESKARYVQDMEARYSPQSFLSSTIIYEAAGGLILLECPLMAGDEFAGVLSVGFRQQDEAEQWTTLLETIAGLAGASIRLIEKDSRYLKQSEVLLANLREYLQKNNAILQHLSLDVSELAYDFARYVNLSEAESEQVKRAGLLAPFQSNRLGEYGFFENELLLLQQVDQLSSRPAVMERPVLPLPVQVLALVLQHIGKQADPEQLSASPQKWLDPSRFRLDAAVTVLVEDESLSSFQTLLQSYGDSQPKKRTIAGTRLLDSAALTLPKEEWGISPREEEVLELIVHGKTNKEIAGALFISEHTVKNHLSRIFHKMKVTDRSQIIALVYKQILNSERIEI